MKIAITGHTKGIGKGLFDRLSTEHDVLGFSRTNGFDISTDKDRIIQESNECDIFINNAQSENHQTYLFNEIFTKWKNEQKTIVNIGSKAKYLMNIESQNRSSYDQAKINLARSALNKMFKIEKKVRVININPGLVYTDLVKHLANNHNMLTVDETVDLIVPILLLPYHIEVGELNFWRTF